MLGDYKNYLYDYQKNNVVWADRGTVFCIYFWLRFPEGCNGEKKFHDAQKVGNGQKQPLQGNWQAKNQ
jgi:hypothetical protein